MDKGRMNGDSIDLDFDFISFLTRNAQHIPLAFADGDRRERS